MMKDMQHAVAGRFKGFILKAKLLEKTVNQPVEANSSPSSWLQHLTQKPTTKAGHINNKKLNKGQ